MRFDFVDSQAILRVTLKKTSEEISSSWRETGQNLDVLFGDHFQDFVSRLVALHRMLFEWIDATNHFVD